MSVKASDVDGRPVCVTAEGGPACFSSMGQQPIVGQGLLVIEASRSHSTRHTDWNSSGRVISCTQRRLHDNTQHSYERERETLMLPAGLEPAFPTSELPHTHTLDRAATHVGYLKNISPY